MNIMASSIYLYNNYEEFESFNKDNFNEKFKTIKIIDMYIHQKTKLWVVTDTNDLIEKPYLQKSLVHFRNATVEEYITDETKLILHDKIKFNPKKMFIDIFPKFLRKPELRWRVDKYINNNDNLETKFVDYDNRYYDFENNRINFVLKN